MRLLKQWNETGSEIITVDYYLVNWKIQPKKYIVVSKYVDVIPPKKVVEYILERELKKKKYN